MTNVHLFSSTATSLFSVDFICVGYRTIVVFIHYTALLDIPFLSQSFETYHLSILSEHPLVLPGKKRFTEELSFDRNREILVITYSVYRESGREKKITTEISCRETKFPACLFRTNKASTEFFWNLKSIFFILSDFFWPW